MIFFRVSRTRVSSSTFSADFNIFSRRGLLCLDVLLGEEFGDVLSFRPLWSYPFMFRKAVVLALRLVFRWNGGDITLLG